MVWMEEDLLTLNSNMLSSILTGIKFRHYIIFRYYTYFIGAGRLEKEDVNT
jgi:hypothetical protein